MLGRVRAQRLATTATLSVGVIAGSCSPSPVRPTIVLSAPTPVPLIGARELRPVLFVTNAATLGAAGSVAYQFDVAGTPDFSPVLIKGMVDEQQAQTLFAVPSDLVPGTTYFWRARTLTSASAVASPYSATQSFATIAAAPPGFAALRLYFDGSCRTFFGEREFTVYGQLTVSGPRWRFAVPPNANPDSRAVFDLTMDLVEAAGRLSGTIHGTGVDPLGFPVFFYDPSSLDVPASATGAVAPNGASGTFSGVFHVAHPSFGLGSPCFGADFPWVLTSSR
jgi:hypothetical protein